MAEEVLELKYIPLSSAVLWDRNPKRHDIGALVESIWRYGFQDPPKFDGALKAFVYGNGRTLAVQAGKNDGRDLPSGIIQIVDSEDWAIPVLFGNDLASKSMAEAFAIDHNNLTLAGGDVDIYDYMKQYEDNVTDILRDLAEADELPVSIDGDDVDAILAGLNKPEEENVPSDWKEWIERIKKLARNLLESEEAPGDVKQWARGIVSDK